MSYIMVWVCLCSVSMPNIIYPLMSIFAIKPKCRGEFCLAATLYLYTLQKYYFNKSCVFRQYLLLHATSEPSSKLLKVRGRMRARARTHTTHTHTHTHTHSMVISWACFFQCFSGKIRLWPTVAQSPVYVQWCISLLHDFSCRL